MHKNLHNIMWNDITIVIYQSFFSCLLLEFSQEISIVRIEPWTVESTFIQQDFYISKSKPKPSDHRIQQ